VVFSGFGSTNKTDRHDITEKLLKVALNTIKPTNQSNQVQSFIKALATRVLTFD
jgi:hypothetical protein